MGCDFPLETQLVPPQFMFETSLSSGLLVTNVVATALSLLILNSSTSKGLVLLVKDELHVQDTLSAFVLGRVLQEGEQDSLSWDVLM